MVVVGSRRRNQPAPPRYVYEALVDPLRPDARPWLVLAADEQPPSVLQSSEPDLVVWSSLWPRVPGAAVRFDLPPARGGTDLRWTLSLPDDDQPPDPGLVGHLCKRLNVLINAELRYSFGS